jgi:histidinol dehydrogenase
MSQPSLAFTGPLAALPSEWRQRLLDRMPSAERDVRRRVVDILERVRVGGDREVLEQMRGFHGDGVRRLEVPRPEWEAALDSAPRELVRVMERAAENIIRVHRAAAPEPMEIETEPGIVVGRRPDPLDRVGIYAPGGRAAYPSSVLMCALPARVAGVREIVLCSPPGPEGLPASAVLAAAALAGVDRVFAIGGASAIAAMAFGTESVPRVDRIVGPGNAYVAEAKLAVAGRVSLDSPAGPTELLVVAGREADPDFIARELIAQAEHDPDACSVAVTEGRRLAERVGEALAARLASTPRREIVAAALAGNGGVLWTDSLEEALAFANRYAPEHLLLAVADPEAALARVRHVGTAFLGGSSSVVFGDYMTGANHTLPTGGLARSYSGLSTSDFVRWTTYQRVSPEAAARLAGDVATFAGAEGLSAHAAAARAFEVPGAAAAPAPASGEESKGVSR